MKKIFVILLLFVSVALNAESIYLNDGSVLQGTILNMSEKNIIIKTEYGTLAIERSKINNIQFKKENQPGRKIPEIGKDKSESNEKKIKVTAQKTSARQPDSWYVAWTMGVSSNLKFSKGLSEFDDGWSKKLPTNMGISFYGTINKNFLLGGGVHVMIAKLNKDDSYYYDSTSSNYSYESISRDLTVSMILLESKFFLNKIGNGLFLEAGVGFGKIEINDEEWDWSEDKKYTIKSKNGFAAKVGIGMAIELEEYESALIFSVGGSYVQAKSDDNNDTYNSSYNNEYKISMLNFSIGILW